MDLRIGTSGYSFEDWRSVFYPENIEKGKMLDYYVQYFPTVEINATYYRIPHPAVMAKITAKAPRGFDFMVKAPQSFTHTRTDLEKDAAAFNEALRPMSESGKLAGILAQFPFSFKFSNNHLEYIKLCQKAVAPHPLYVEFRHNSWVNRTMYDYLIAGHIGYVCVDEPQLPGLLGPDVFATTETAYIRLHGRNAEKWWEGGAERYDYCYSENELKTWKDKIEKLSLKVKRIYVFFNNCHHGQAARNAREFMRQLNL
ncbi:MAG: DUF72 domain-containing protein [candidate division Zixibacteria bacterium]|nr:DUF72 domain-containing protein [candidate division Zixibacteria bacterium]MDD5426000.1 DUF72 domain-containing protein [candidate division Zixibacteria bacterium]